jgi:hypothetical protein
MVEPTVYITPAGYICTCGVCVATVTGAAAARMAYKHKEHAHSQFPDMKTIDYRIPKLKECNHTPNANQARDR